MELALIALINYHAAMNGIDPNLALAVAKVESGLNMEVVGSKGERGAFQLLPSAFPKYTIQELSNPKKNVELGIKHLAWNKKHCKHQGKLNFLVCYNYGIKNAEKVKHPDLFPYVKKVTKEYYKVKKVYANVE